MVREAVEQRHRHLGIDEDGRPFAEGEIGRDDDRRALIEAVDEFQASEIVAEPSLASRPADGPSPVYVTFVPSQCGG